MLKVSIFVDMIMMDIAIIPSDHKNSENYAIRLPYSNLPVGHRPCGL